MCVLLQFTVYAYLKCTQFDSQSTVIHVHFKMHKHLRDWISWLIQYIHYLQMIYSKWTEDTTTAFFLTLCLTLHAIWPPVISVITQNHTSDTRGNTKIISIKNNTAFSKKVKCAVATSASLFPRNLALILKKNGWRFYKSFFF